MQTGDQSLRSVFNSSLLWKIMTSTAMLVVMSPGNRLAAADGKPTDSKQASRPTVLLEVPSGDETAYQKLLVREVIRQAFLLSAREEFHAVTRDRMLREDFDGKNPQLFQFLIDINSSKPGEIQPTLKSLSRKTTLKPWSVTISAKGEQQLEQVLPAAEKWSREDFVEFLKSAQVPVASVVFPKPELDLNAQVPLEFVAQVGALRKLHAALLQEPESPDLLVRLVEQNALLGSLTATHWGAESKIFQARSLLYAERAFHMYPENAAIAWARGMAWGLCGRHDLAKAEIARARTLGKPEDAPSWGASLDAFVIWNDPELRKCIDEERPLAAYFQFLAMEMIGTEDQRIHAVTSLMQGAPECFRAAYVMSQESQIGLKRSVGGTQFRQFLISFPESLQEVNGVPEDIKKSARELMNLSEPGEIIPKTADLVQALHQVPSSKDSSEPSLSLLATLTQNLHFLHSVQILQTHQWSLGISTESMRPIFKALLRDHPARDFVDVFNTDSSIVQKAYKKVLPDLMALPVTEATWKPTLSLIRYRVTEQDWMYKQIRDERDDVLPDLLAKVEDTVFPKECLKAAGLIEKLSPECPGWVIALIELDWKNSRQRTSEWEEKFPVPAVLKALGIQFSKTASANEEDRAAAERCWKKLADVEPTFMNYRSLAQFFLTVGNREQWEQTLLKSLKLQTYGLDDAIVNRDLANWYMSEHKFTKARPFAMAAAESYSSWGLMCGARCLEGLREWEECEKLVRANSERYDNAWFEWYLWCQRTGHGDLEAAREYCFQATSKFSPHQRSASEELAIFLLMEGSLDEALNIMKQLKSRDQTGYWTIHTALVLDQQQQSAERDRILRQHVNDLPDRFSMWLAEQMILAPHAASKAFSEGHAQFCYDFAALSDNATNAAYFIGKALLLRNREQEAILWLQKAASSPMTIKWNCTLAIEELRRLEKEIPETREQELDPKYVEGFKQFHSVMVLRETKKYEEAVQAAQKILNANPDWSLGQYVCARALDSAKRYDESEQLFSKLLDKFPQQPQILMARGEIREKLNNIPGAKADYTAALRIAPGLQPVEKHLQTLENK